MTGHCNGSSSPFDRSEPNNIDAACGSPARSPSSTSPGSRTTPPPSATTPPGGCSARSARIVREVATERGVRIAKWLGDGCMIVSVEQHDAHRLRARPRAARRRRVRAADPPGRHRHRARPAVRGRRLHRLGRQHGRPPVRLRRASRC